MEGYIVQHKFARTDVPVPKPVEKEEDEKENPKAAE